MDMALHSRDAVTVSAAVATRSRAEVWKAIHTIKWPYQPEHSPSLYLPHLETRAISNLCARIILTRESSDVYNTPSVDPPSLPTLFGYQPPSVDRPTPLVDP